MKIQSRSWTEEKYEYSESFIEFVRFNSQVGTSRTPTEWNEYNYGGGNYPADTNHVPSYRHLLPSLN